MMATAETPIQAAEHGAEHAEQGFDAAGMIMHHVVDSPKWEFLPGIDFYFPFGISKHMVMMWLAFILLFVLFRLAARQKSLVPRGLRNLLEVMVLFVRDEVARKAIPHGGDAFVPFLLTMFLFILACNLIGLVPFMATATGNIAVTAALALISFLVIQVSGLKNYGVVGHLKNFIPGGVPGWLIPLIFPLELIGALIKPFVLAVRLFANMLAGHMVIFAFFGLIFILGEAFGTGIGLASSIPAIGLALFVYFLEVLVAFLQAFIFTMLTAQFIGMSVHPSH